MAGDTRKGRKQTVILQEHQEHMVQREAVSCFPAILPFTLQQIQVAPVAAGVDGSCVSWTEGYKEVVLS